MVLCSLEDQHNQTSLMTRNFLQNFNLIMCQVVQSVQNFDTEAAWTLRPSLQPQFCCHPAVTQIYIYQMYLKSCSNHALIGSELCYISVTPNQLNGAVCKLQTILVTEAVIQWILILLVPVPCNIACGQPYIRRQGVTMVKTITHACMHAFVQACTPMCTYQTVSLWWQGWLNNGSSPKDC